MSRVLVNTHLSRRRRLWRRELPTETPPETVVPDNEIGMTDEQAVL
ncbi:hypothetical protein ACGFJC_52485 [Nonomuraea fuscirosea]